MLLFLFFQQMEQQPPFPPAGGRVAFCCGVAIVENGVFVVIVVLPWLVPSLYVLPFGNNDTFTGVGCSYFGIFMSTKVFESSNIRPMHKSRIPAGPDAFSTFSSGQCLSNRSCFSCCTVIVSGIVTSTDTPSWFANKNFSLYSAILLLPYILHAPRKIHALIIKQMTPITAAQSQPKAKLSYLVKEGSWSNRCHTYAMANSR